MLSCAAMLSVVRIMPILYVMRVKKKTILYISQ